MMISKFIVAIIAWTAFFEQQALCFSTSSRHTSTQRTTRVHRLLMNKISTETNVVTSSSSLISISSTRRNIFGQFAAVAATSLYFVDPAWAVSGLNKVNAKLNGFGLPPIASVPDGFSPLLEVYGKGKNRTPLLITFSHPLTWVVTLPSNTVNGEDGTIQAGEYAKGDTATLYVYSDAGNVGDITKQSKELFETVLKRCISQRGDNMYQNFKITKLTPGTGDYLKGQSYMMADFKYTLLTGAGFEVDRKGVASISSTGNAVEALWAASTDVRYKKTESVLRSIVDSFRVYSEGINFSDDLVYLES